MLIYCHVGTGTDCDLLVRSDGNSRDDFGVIPVRLVDPEKPINPAAGSELERRPDAPERMAGVSRDFRTGFEVSR
jgi:hypothetical protein